VTFIETIPEDAGIGATAGLYAAEEEALGFLPNFVRAFSLRPEVYGAWKGLNGAINGGMDLRRYTATSSMSCSQPRRAASSARSSTLSGRSPTADTPGSIRPCARR
jgi:hypothetical protein